MKKTNLITTLAAVLALTLAGGIAKGVSNNLSLEQRAQQENSCKADNQAKPQENYLAYARYTGNFEGKRPRVYDPNPKDGKYEPTVGVGFYLDREGAKEDFEKALPEADYNSVKSGRQELTNEQIDRLFAYDLPKYIEKARGFFPKFDTYPEYLRVALVDGCYRGDLSGSPKTRKLINAGKWKQAAGEYINRKDYRNAVKNKMAGIKRRMDSNKAAMEKYAGETK